MEITEIKRIGKSEQYRIFVDDEFYCVLEAEIIVKHKIKIGHFNEDEFLGARQESEQISCFNDALKFVSKCLKTEKQVKDKLKEKGYMPDSIINATNKLVDYKYIDDKYYAECFIKSKCSQKGKMYLINSLSQKGISKDILNEVFENYESDSNDILILAKKYLRNKEMTNETKQRMYRHLISKGFSYSEVVKSCKSLFNGDEDDWN